MSIPFSFFTFACISSSVNPAVLMLYYGLSAVSTHRAHRSFYAIPKASLYTELSSRVECRLAYVLALILELLQSSFQEVLAEAAEFRLFLHE